MDIAEAVFFAGMLAVGLSFAGILVVFFWKPLGLAMLLAGLVLMMAVVMVILGSLGYDGLKR